MAYFNGKKTLSVDLITKVPTAQLEITENGEYNVMQYGSVDVDVASSSVVPETPTDSLLFYSANEISINIYNATKNWDGTLYYSTDHSTWSVWDGTTEIVSALNNGWHTLYLRGIGNTHITGNANTRRFVIKGAGIKCVGNCNNLLDYTTNPTLSNYAFAYLFMYCGNVDFDVTLPATILSTNCYSSMFAYCSSLKTAPALPATILSTSCYDSMFNNCISLTTVPELPATTLASYCYSNMFSNTSITTVPKLPLTKLYTYCYRAMFSGCALLTSIPALPATALESHCYDAMFNGCLKIKLSTTQEGDYQNEYRIPTSGTGTTASSVLQNMFANTGGTFTGTPTINTTYYTSNTVIPAT